MDFGLSQEQEMLQQSAREFLTQECPTTFVRAMYTEPDGSRYEGSWQNGKPNGYGKAVLKNGTVYQGTWTNGCFQQGGRQAWFDTSKEECGFK